MGKHIISFFLFLQLPYYEWCWISIIGFILGRDPALHSGYVYTSQNIQGCWRSK